MLTGQIPPSNGDGLIFGLSIVLELLKIRRIIGICPQHDILFNELTPREHIELYAGLKKVPRSLIQSLVKERLEGVKLYNVADKQVKEFSGGYFYFN